ncbi:type I-E CRISPR-associated endonuclease Cas1 [Roseibium sp. RKSG952]|nr:type I-E CRISPR-associated endonuclease Cas1 [Roseibium sp. RKSG952]
MDGGVGFLTGRLGVETARIPHKSRHGLLWVERGTIGIEDGCLIFKTSGFGDIPPGEYGIPHQGISTLLMGPGTSISHDVLRVLNGHGTSILAVGSGGVRIYSAPPLIPDNSSIARSHATLWSDLPSRTFVARKMFALRFGEVFPHRNLNVLRGIEGGRIKKVYEIQAGKYRIPWNGRRFDRANPEKSDLANQAINHSATAVYAFSAIAVYSVGAIPQLGFIHESSGDAFCLDVADLYRATITVPIAFECARFTMDHPEVSLERHVRHEINKLARKQSLVDEMIDRIKGLLNVDDYSDHKGC